MFFFSFDGVDGVGKSTQMGLFCDWLEQQGREVVTCRDPGSTELGEALRTLLLDRHELSIHRRSEMLMYMAARAQLVDEVIGRALASGKTVVSDRFLLANVVYQGYAGGLDVEQIWQVGQIATGGLTPHLTVLLDMDVAAAGRRLNRPRDRMEAQGDAFLQRVRQGFLREAERRPEIVVVDADREVNAIQAEIRAAASERMQRHPAG